MYVTKAQPKTNTNHTGRKTSKLNNKTTTTTTTTGGGEGGREGGGTTTTTTVTTTTTTLPVVFRLFLDLFHGFQLVVAQTAARWNWIRVALGFSVRRRH